MLQDQAMLAKLSISQWTARKHDRAVSREVDAAHGARDAGRYNKLLIDKNVLAPIASAASSIRDAHYRMTLPWDDEGARLLPSKLFMQYTAEMRKLRVTFETQVTALATAYPQIVQDARIRLGSMYNPEDYPQDIAPRFGVTVGFSPVPAAADFRVDVGAENIAQIRQEITASNDARQAEVTKECWRRVRAVLERYADRLSDPTNKFHDTLVESAAELVTLLPALNITGDPELTQITQELKDKLLPASPHTLRKNFRVRKNVAEAANDILSRIPWSQ